MDEIGELCTHRSSWAHVRCSMTASQQQNKCSDHVAGQAGQGVRLREVSNLPVATQLDVETGFTPRLSCPWGSLPPPAGHPWTTRGCHINKMVMSFGECRAHVQVVASGNRIRVGLRTGKAPSP